MNRTTCDHCGKPVTFAKGDQRGDYIAVGIRRLGEGYGRNCGYQSIHVHWRCLDAWRAVNGNKTPAAQPALS